MSISLGFYTDADLTNSITFSTLTLDRSLSGPHVDKQLWLGSPIAQRRFEADDAGPIQVSVLDGAPADGGFTPADFKLASSQAALGVCRTFQAFA